MHACGQASVRASTTGRQVNGSRSSLFVGRRPEHHAAQCTTAPSRRPCVEVNAKGKTGRRGMSSPPQTAPIPPVPPVDPDNAEFVIFIRSKKLPVWIPFTLIKGGTSANVLVKTWETSGGDNDTVKNTLTRNVGQALYKDYAKICNTARSQFPQLKHVKEFEFGMKIRDKSEPKSWYVPSKVWLIPPEADLPGTPIDNLKDNVFNFFKGMGGGDGKKK